MSHEHTNRDMGSRRNGTSATDCIRYIARAAAKLHTHPAIRQGLVQAQRDAWQSLTRGPFATSADSITRARLECGERADALDVVIGQLADVLGSNSHRADRDRFAR
ncbi:hypothetical protein AB0K35_27950 [Micromonospora sp. NPDC053740]|uniref:hypothetical protein n=1 Tax=Micromonospora sp. NPDC053740 TaxID=3155173 RepID=UPI00342B42A7